MQIYKKNNDRMRGFTLVELMVAVGISCLVMAGVMSVFLSQRNSYNAQDQVVEMQQNLRAAIAFMRKEMRMASYNPIGKSQGRIDVGFTETLPSQMTFSFEIDKALPDPTRQSIQYRLFDSYENGDGVFDLGRQPGINANISAFAESIEAIDFMYLDDMERPTEDASEIVSIRVSILARANQPDLNFLNTMEYFPASCPEPLPPAQPGPADYACVESKLPTGFDPGDPTIGSWDLNPGVDGDITPNDNFRRRLLIATINVRND
ncbi:MAG: prepilin-type N-terminal cleavage/methylation domain-containing protein [Proteobacteria bacterium]|nr:prepilin-type N-terminal cleavage/methylation domain-containing protein [Pseudomonadota bacterium]MBU1716396.1 prepilin-type N-terminal cleavage/methylation domain-containing protein [Pseudomonadota bacterium]